MVVFKCLNCGSRINSSYSSYENFLLNYYDLKNSGAIITQEGLDEYVKKHLEK